MYYMTYGNNDYRDYVLAHSRGPWENTKTKFIDKIVTAGGKVRYIYDDVKKKAGNYISKNITGSYYKSRMNNANIAKKNYRSAGNVSGMHQAEKAWSKNKAGYDRSVAGRITGAASKLGVRLNRVRKNLVSRGRDLVNKVRGAISNIRGAIRGKYQDWRLKRKGGAGKGSKLTGSGAGKNDLVAKGSGSDSAGALKTTASSASLKGRNVSSFKYNDLSDAQRHYNAKNRKRKPQRAARYTY